MARIAGVEYLLPDRVVTTEDLQNEFPDWSPGKIAAKLGIDAVHVAADNECASDLAVRVAEKLFATGLARRAHVDYLILLTQTPDYILPTTACLLQDRLSLPHGIGAIDVNLGCSGYIYGLGLAHGLIQSGQARHVLLITADTYSKIVHPLDRPMRVLLGDAATATLVDDGRDAIGSFVYGTDGRRAMNIVVPAGGFRKRQPDGVLVMDDKGNGRTDAHVHMNGRGMFAFSAEVVPDVVDKALAKAGVKKKDIDLFFFHQANKHMIDHLMEHMALPPENVVLDMRDGGSTGSSSIPIAISRAAASGRLKSGMKILLVGYGVGLSWGACLVRW